MTKLRRVGQDPRSVANLRAQVDMRILTAFLAAILRFVFPPHTGKRVRGRANRVRPYTNPLPARPTGPGYPNPFAAVAPIASYPHPLPPANIVRPGYRAWERRQRLAPGTTARAVYVRHMTMHGQDATLAREWSARCHMYGTELRALADSGDAMAEEVLRARVAKWERRGLPVDQMMHERGRGLPREVFDAVHVAYAEVAA